MANKEALRDAVFKAVEAYCAADFGYSFDPNNPIVRLHEPTFSAGEINAALECLLSTYVTMGPKVKKFEEVFASTFGWTDGVMNNSGSSANLLAVAALANPATKDGLKPGDEVIVPSPGWISYADQIKLCGGVPVHVSCPENNHFKLRAEDLEAAITPRTKWVVLNFPNNPTGALYPPEVLKDLLQVARDHGLIVFADEIYDKTLYDGVTHTAIASLAEDVLFVSFNGLSKNSRACGYRSGWMVISGDKRHAQDYIEGLVMLASMRLCANVPGQLAIQTALGGYQSIKDLVAPGGRLCRQRDLAHALLTQIPGVSCYKPKAALYMFPRLDSKRFPIADDQQFALEMLENEKVLVVQGSGFNWPHPDHFRLVFLPNSDDLTEAIGRIARFLDGYQRRHQA